MNIAKTWIAGFAGGALVAVSLVVACSDDTVNHVDAAATCDCPAAEPPLAGRVVSVRAQGNVSAGGLGVAGVLCPAGAKVLGGACELMTQDANVLLSSAKFDRGAQEGYSCVWSATDATVNNFGFAEAICLVPAQ